MADQIDPSWKAERCPCGSFVTGFVEGRDQWSVDHAKSCAIWSRVKPRVKTLCLSTECPNEIWAGNWCFEHRHMVSPVTHPTHYTSHPSGVECIQVVQWMTFNIGNAVKYLWRAGLKGDMKEDLLKARQYIDFELKRLEVVKSDGG